MADHENVLLFQPLQIQDFYGLPGGFEYSHEISEGSNTTAFDTGLDTRDKRRCIVCGARASGGPRPGVQGAHIIGRTESDTWKTLKKIGYVPSFAKSVAHEPRNGICLCDGHHSDFDGFRFYIRWVPSSAGTINQSKKSALKDFHGKKVRLDPDNIRSPFPALFLVHETRTRGFHPWNPDLPLSRPISLTYDPNDSDDDSDDDNIDGSARPWGSGSGIGPGGGPDMGWGGGGTKRSGRDNGAAGSSSGAAFTGSPQYLLLSNPFHDPKQLNSMRDQWQQLPNWKAATVEGLTWEGTAEENARKYIDLVGVDPR